VLPESIRRHDDRCPNACPHSDGPPNRHDDACADTATIPFPYAVKDTDARDIHPADAVSNVDGRNRDTRAHCACYIGCVRDSNK
jgi:hypothetical protein